MGAYISRAMNFSTGFSALQGGGEVGEIYFGTLHLHFALLPLESFAFLP